MEKIVFLDRGTLPIDVPKLKIPHHWTEFDSTAPAEVAARLKGATIAITNKVKVDEAVLAQLPELKLIAVAATGYDCVDIQNCRKRKIAVSNVPGYTGDSVPEHVFMMMLALRRNLSGFSRLIQQGAWQQAPHFVMLDYPIENLSGSVLGLIGYGRLARAVEARAKVFGMKILISEHKGAKEVRAGRTAFQDVLKAADVITLHCPLSPDTRGLMGERELHDMKTSALLINTARGGLVDERALAEALLAKEIAGAGIDVLSEEPPRKGSPLLELQVPNLIVTPHVAWSSRQSLNVLAEEIIQNIEAYVSGKPRNLVS